MRNEALVGYLLHQRSYQEKRAIYYLFSQQHGVVHGIGKKGAPLFEPLQLFATGKRDLKTFTQIWPRKPLNTLDVRDLAGVVLGFLGGGHRPFLLFLGEKLRHLCGFPLGNAF
mgnify:CR=1 FL=1